MATKIYTDDLSGPVFDVTDDLRAMNLIVLDKNIVRAERCESNVLILQRRAGGHWLIQYWWLRSDNAVLDSVQGSESVKFPRNNIDPEQSLFKQVNLF